jgi:dipeptidyl aminopeptidase/acylaminoacyl peptidase
MTLSRCALLPLTLVVGCGGATAPPAAAPAPAAPVVAPAPAPATAAPAPAAPVYQGHGATSIAPELVARFAPAPLDRARSAHIQSMMDVRGTGTGILTTKGDRMVYASRVTGVQQIWRQDGPSTFAVQLTGGEDTTSVVGLTPDDRFVVVERDRGGEENPGLYLLPIEGGPLREIQHKPGVQTFHEVVSDDGRWLYFRANDVEPSSYALYRHEIATGKRETVLAEPGLWTIADLRGDKLLLRKLLGNTQTEIHELDLPTGKRTPLLGVGEVAMYDARYGAAEGTLVVLTNQPGEFFRLYEWKAGKLAPISPDVRHDVEEFAIDRARTRIVYELNEGGYQRVRALDARSKKLLPLSLPAADRAVVASLSRTGRFAVLALDSAQSLQMTTVWDWKTRKATTWRTPSAPEVDLTSFAPVTLESYPARDGTAIPMFVRRPTKCAADPCPVVVAFHGGPESQSVAGFSTGAQLFVDAGFVYVEPNVRGSTGYGKAWLHADDGPRRLEVITDIEDAARHIRTAWAKDGRAPRIGVYGGSYGGYSVLMAMTYFAGAYDVGVSVVGIANLHTFLANTAPYRRILRASEYGDPDKDKDALVKLSPTTYVDRVKAPLLIIQGLNDPRVPAGEALVIRSALEARGVDSGLIIFPDEGHGMKKRSNQVRAIGHTLAFFEKHLLGK